jgi:hypothetical protein
MTKSTSLSKWGASKGRIDKKIDDIKVVMK